MADCYFLCALFVFWNLVDGTPHLKGLYCQDPDTSKLYPINSTWPSETFCGNYTCKLRKKNITQTEYAPFMKINITSNNEDKLINDMATNPSEQAFVVVNKPSIKQPVYHKEAINRINSIAEYNGGGQDSPDRYLTESEIKSITEILHTVKKSDLEAIVEIYNIAQDIYKEMDTAITDKHDENSKNTNTIQSDKNEMKTKLNTSGKESISYWYEPLQHSSSTKVKPKDSKSDGTNAIPTAQSFTHPATYFKGPLTEKDFGKLPYYYPMSNFQRMSSYMRDKMPYNMQEHISRQHIPCRYKQFNNNLPPWFNAPTNSRNVPEQAKPQVMQPMLLPYPFSYIHHYNLSAYQPGSFYYNYPWTQLDIYNRNKNYPQQYFGAYVTPIPTTAVVSNLEELEQKYDDRANNNEDDTDSLTDPEIRYPEWQTEELSDKVLEEVKANILDNSKLLKPLIPLRKNIKLEKVGKVIKLDELTRAKRDVSDTDNVSPVIDSIQYEPYIERTTCESGTELGFFRMGNMTEPYPACCPQKISS